MISSADKTIKSSPSVQQKTAGNTFFRKAGEETFFGAKQNPAFFNAPVQAKLKVSSPDDPQEKEADAVADKVMRMPEPVSLSPIADNKEEQASRKEDEVQPKHETPLANTIQCKEESEEKLQAKLHESVNRKEEEHIDTKAQQDQHESSETNLHPKNISLYQSDITRQSGRGPPAASVPFETTLASSKGGGNALPNDTRAFMENRFNADFSGVRVHTDPRAETMSRSVNAQAFAHGSDIYFNSGKFAPNSTEGRTLLAHELTHTIQQGSAKSLATSAQPSSVAKKDSVHLRSVKASSSTQKNIAAKPCKTSGVFASDINQKQEYSQSEKTPENHSKLENSLSKTSVDCNGNLHLSLHPTIHKKDAPQKNERGEEEKLPEDRQHQNQSQHIKESGNANIKHRPDPASNNTENVFAKISCSSAGIQLKSNRTSATDPAFKAVVTKVKGAAQQAKKHDPSAKKVKEAQSAAKPPANEKESLAKDKKVAEMAQQEPGTFDEAKFKAALREKIAALQMNTLKEAENFKASNGAASVKGDVSQQVSSEKQKAAGSIEGKVKEAPAPGSVQGKEVGAEPTAAGDVTPPAISGAEAAPKPVAAEDVSLQKDSQNLDKQMADAKVTDQQLSKSNEPKFTGALASKKTAQQDAVQRPQQFRKDEKGILTNAQATAAGVSKTQLASIAGTRKQKMGGVLGKQQIAKAKDEADRAKVAADIEAKFTVTKTDVEGILSKLDTDVAAMFDQGVSDATKGFEDYVDQQVRQYKIDRYLNRVGGSLLWAADLLLGLPDEVNDIYKRGKDRYVKQMDAVINKVAKLVVSQLNSAKKRIAQGKQEIKSFVKKLPKNLQSIGKEAAKNIQSQFSELEQGVNNKQNELVDTLAAKYKAGLENVDKKIDEMKEANKGLVDKAIGAIKEVIDAIIEFKNMLLNVLARAAAAIDLIIEDPIGFLGNLVAGVKQGIQNFVGNIAAHLKKGLMGWLFGTLAQAGIQMPDSFDAKGIISLVLQVLGLTYANIRSRAVNIVGEKVVAGLEKAAEIFIVIKNEGVGGLWRLIKEKVEQLKDTVIDAIKSFVIEKIVVAGVTWLISLLNPASAFIKACKMIYDVIMFFVTRGKQIMDLVNAVIDSVTAIAQGAIGVAASAVENALSKALPVAISFLASLLGLDGISEKIKAIIAKIQAPINAAIDWLINKAVKLVKGAGKLLMMGGKKAVGAIKNLLGIKKVFSASDGVSHSLFFKGDQKKPELMVATTEFPVREALSKISIKIKEPENLKYKNNYDNANRLTSTIKEMSSTIQNKNEEGYKSEDIEKINGLLRDLSGNMEVLMPLISPTKTDSGNLAEVGDLLNIKSSGKYATVSSVTDTMISYKFLRPGMREVTAEGFLKTKFKEKMDSKEIVKEMSDKKKRDLYMGSTPKISDDDVGNKVKKRMRSMNKYDTPQKPGEFMDRSGKWFSLSEANMGHVIDAVLWWNSNGRFKGPKAPEVIKFMNDPDNYELEDKVQNQLRGSKQGDRYLPPAT